MFRLNLSFARLSIFMKSAISVLVRLSPSSFGRFRPRSISNIPAWHFYTVISAWSFCRTYRGLSLARVFFRSLIHRTSEKLLDKCIFTLYIFDNTRNILDVKHTLPPKKLQILNILNFFCSVSMSSGHRQPETSTPAGYRRQLRQALADTPPTGMTRLGCQWAAGEVCTGRPGMDELLLWLWSRVCCLCGCS